MHWTAIPDSPDMLRPRFVFETNHNRLSLQKTGLTSAHLPDLQHPGQCGPGCVLTGLTSAHLPDY